MQLTFWGVRGSVPAPERDSWRYGGNTPCLELRDSDGQIFILDAGTGIRDLGRHLMADFIVPGLQATLFLSHYHWDHVQGLPFFEPLYFAGNTIAIYGPRPQAEAPSSLAGVIHVLFRSPFFPVTTANLKASYPLQELDWGSDFTLGSTRIRTCRVNHPQGALAYRFDNRGASVVYATDHEPGNPERDFALRQLARGADLLISDAQYRPEELGAQKAGWGHGSWKASAELALAAEVKNLILYHHDPVRSDLELDQILLDARQIFPHTWAAAEGMRLDIARKQVRVENRSQRISQRTPVHWPAQVETRDDATLVREEARLENLSVQGAYFVSPRSYELQQPVDLAVAVHPNGNRAAQGRDLAELRLRGYVVRTEPLTTNGGWVGVGVLFPAAPGTPPEAGAKPPSRPDSD